MNKKKKIIKNIHKFFDEINSFLYDDICDLIKIILIICIYSIYFEYYFTFLNVIVVFLCFSPTN